MKRRELGLQSTLAGLALLLGRKAAQAQSRIGRSLEGAWRVSVVNGPGAPPALPTRWETFISFSAGGTLLEYNGQPGFTPAHGVWSYAGNDVFDGTWLRYNYNPQGEIQTVAKVRSRIRMLSDEEYTNDVRVDLYGPGGQVLLSWPATSQGKRIVVEPLV